MDLPDQETLRALVSSLARVRAACGDAVTSAPLVLPTREYFPEGFTPDASGVARVVGRLIEHGPLPDDTRVEIVVLVADDPHGGGGCGSAACGTGPGAAPMRGVEAIDGGYRAFIAAADVAQPLLVAASLARSVGAILVHETLGAEQADPATAEIAAIACGLGVLVTNGAAVWAKSCGGLRMTQGTALTVEEAAVALALFVGSVKGGVRAAGRGPGRSDVVDARKYLEATQREAFDLALAWVESNPLLLETLRDRPAVLEGCAFTIEPLRGVLGRWLHKRKLKKELAVAATAAAAPISDDKRRRLQEAKALVDEVLGD